MLLGVGLKQQRTVQVPNIVLPFWGDCCSVAVIGVVLVVKMEVVHVVVLQAVTQVPSLVLRHMWCFQQIGSQGPIQVPASGNNSKVTST